MIAYPLEAPLRTLPRDQSVYVVRQGLVFLYSAEILSDIANDRYTMDEIVAPIDSDWGTAKASTDSAQTLYAACFRCWQLNRATRDTFKLWWESIDKRGDWQIIAAVAAVAARELMTVQLFAHRHLDGARALP